jgi:hypothetical protein
VRQVALLVTLVANLEIAAFIPTLADADLARAVALARWPTSEADRERFHRRYVFNVNGTTTPVGVERIEVITPFRRLELIAEERARINDYLFARGGLRDAQDVMRPWQERVTIAGHLRFPFNNTFVEVPAVEVILDGWQLLSALETHREPVFTTQGKVSVLVGGTIDAQFDAELVGNTVRQAFVVWKGQELARVTIDFASLD